MASESTPPTSFSARRRWGLFFSVVISIIAVIALVAMVNYLGARYFLRFPLSGQTEIKLSQQTLFLLKSITNQVKVTIYYDKTDPLYSHVAAWLDEYHLKNPKITVQTVDYLRDAALAQQIKAAYKLVNAEDKNLVIFDCNGRLKIVQESLLADYKLELIPNEKEREFERRLKAFNGEMQFTPALLTVVSQKPRKAYFLQDNGEHDLESRNDDGYQKFGALLEQNNVTNSVLRLTGTNVIPADCNLLVIAGPRKAIPPEELAKIRQYLDQGGRLFVLFNYYTRQTKTGLESILADWNIDVGLNLIADRENQASGGPSSGVIEVQNWKRNHPVSDRLLMSKSRLNMVLPRSIKVLNENKQGLETPKVENLAFTGPKATIGTVGDNFVPAGTNVSLIAAAERGSIKGVLQERGTTAILVTGDSIFLSNQAIDYADNADFAQLAINWLLDQTELLQGVGPHPVKEYKLMMTHAEMNSLSWLFLAIMPGAVLAFGGLVWFRRRR